MPGGSGRRAAFPTEMRGSYTTNGDGRQFYEVDGYATVFNRSYQMWDAFGTYREVADSGMLDRSLALSPDVAFLLNHTGATMARTRNGTLTLTKDTHGLRARAKLNPDRSDVKDLASAIDDGLIDEMSFAFVIDDGEWDDNFETYTLKQVDINRGDVSAVNYGANPYTSIGAMSQDFMRMAENMPMSVISVAARLASESDTRELGSVADTARRLSEMSGTSVADLRKLIDQV